MVWNAAREEREAAIQNAREEREQQRHLEAEVRERKWTLEVEKRRSDGDQKRRLEDAVRHRQDDEERASREQRMMQLQMSMFAQILGKQKDSS